ncbi:MAG TPA: NTP transferase domain-containing protein, partial [Ktedonobacterales bacterium]|nr:NTP transferase domain-containing protein [Ktedonobacterales bacterium]
GRLALWLLGRVAGALTSSGAVCATAVVSPDAAVLAWARQAGLVALPQQAGELNDAVALGAGWARRLGADALLVTLGDLPFLTGGEVRALAARGADLARHPSPGAPGSAVLAPDRAGTGTNALYVAPPVALPFVFGAASRERFTALAAQAGVSLDTFTSPGTAFDVDGADDLTLLRRRMGWPVGALGDVPPLPGLGRADERTA